ncbi:unnamed protein product [Prunus armeniaca]|uniref:Uncharacterized protein n=1 Tax=Prunus armeniaca TaxID=36596 RepID=A0A6J5V9B1_PRUAR|nr:unnamed protein product [Prunus armeniaca]
MVARSFEADHNYSTFGVSALTMTPTMASKFSNSSSSLSPPFLGTCNSLQVYRKQSKQSFWRKLKKISMAEGKGTQIPRVKLGNQGLEV